MGGGLGRLHRLSEAESGRARVIAVELLDRGLLEHLGQSGVIEGEPHSMLAQPAHALQAGTGWAQSPAVAVDDEGNAAVAWVEHVGATASVWVNRFEVDRR